MTFHNYHVESTVNKKKIEFQISVQTAISNPTINKENAAEDTLEVCVN